MLRGSWLYKRHRRSRRWGRFATSVSAHLRGQSNAVFPSIHRHTAGTRLRSRLAEDSIQVTVTDATR